MVIDANMYWLPESLFEEDTDAFLSEIPTQYDLYGYLRQEELGMKQIVIEKPTGYQNLNYVQGEYQLERQLRDLDEAGVEKAVLKLPGCQEWMSLAMCKKFNDGMLEASLKSNGRLIPLAVLPPFASKACFEELDRCRKLGFHGVQLIAHYGNHYLDSPIFQAFFEKLNEVKTTVYIHHTPVPVEHGALYEYNNLRRSYGRCADQTTAICREVFGGFFDRYPNLTMVHSMLGGGIFAIADMMFPAKPKHEDSIARFDDHQKEKDQFQSHVYFEMSHAQPWGKAQLECAIAVLGADHILFGSSYPVRKEWLTKGVEAIHRLAISEEEKAMLLYKNAQRLYNI